MAVEVKKEIQLEIAHVLFIDIVGYSKLLTDEQSEALQELNQIVRNTEAAREAESAGQLIILPTGHACANQAPRSASSANRPARSGSAETIRSHSGSISLAAACGTFRSTARNRTRPRGSWRR